MGLKKKSYCILNKQYSKESFNALKAEIIKHMSERPYTDKDGKVYKYGEFFPPEFSPFAYNETIAYDFFPLSKEETTRRGFLWRDSEVKEIKVSIKAEDLPDHIAQANNSIVSEVIKCFYCTKPYRIIQMELDFYRRFSLPLPRLCPNCRHEKRVKYRNPPRFYDRKCQCAGVEDGGVYKNTAAHSHGISFCTNKFKTSYAPERPEIVYCETCYNTEVM